MQIDVLFEEGFEDCIDAGWLQDIAEKALAAEGFGDDIEMGLFITGQERVRGLNKAYRNKDKPTDVLSFAFLADSSEGEGPSFSTPPDGLKHLGEVIISYPQAIIQAQERNHSIKMELAILVIHGVLHLLDYDHMEDEEADEMESRQNEILESLKEALD
jgi:probable rRNA maturation factor